MRGIITIIIGLISIQIMAQFPIGHRTITFNDASRSRDIECEIYYPGTTAGEDVGTASGTFPVIVLGHGYNMGYDAYLNFSDRLVPLGYVIVMPTTESGLSPDHQEFGLDLEFINNEVKSQATSNASFFLYNHFNSRTAIAGHSMGGGSSFLAAASNPNITALINFAAAETDPSAIAVAPSVIVPVLMFSGENDGVAPPLDHQIPMYNALTANICKYKIVINGGGHCYFADDNTICSLGELFTTPQPTIDRETQHDIQFNLMIPFLDWQLMGNAASKIVFMDSLSSSNRVTYEFSCPMASMEETQSNFQVYPNPATETVNIEGTELEIIRLYDISGRLIMTVPASGIASQLNIETLEPGIYVLSITQADQQRSILLEKE